MRDDTEGGFVDEPDWMDEESGFPDNKEIDLGEEDFDWYEDDSGLIDATVGGAHKSSWR